MYRSLHEISFASTKLTAKVRDTVRHLKDLERSFVVAASGGIDSTALLWLACQSGSEVTAVHFQHHLRPEAHNDEASVRANAKAFGARFVVFHLDPKALHDSAAGVQAAAREARYEGLTRVAEERNAIVLTGHHIEDLMETFVMRLDTGCGMRGAFGPREWANLHGQTIHRPILHWWKDELEAVLHASGTAWVEDTSNAQTEYRRNSLRAPLQSLYDKLTNRERFAQSLLGISRESWTFFPNDLVHADDDTAWTDFEAEPVEIPRAFFTDLHDVAASATTLFESVREFPARPRRDTLQRAVQMLRDEHTGFLMDHRLLYEIRRDGIHVRFCADPRATLEETKANRAKPSEFVRLEAGRPQRVNDVEITLNDELSSDTSLWARPLVPGDLVQSQRSGRVSSAMKRLSRDSVPAEHRERAILIVMCSDGEEPSRAEHGIALIHSGRRIFPIELLDGRKFEIQCSLPESDAWRF